MTSPDIQHSCCHLQGGRTVEYHNPLSSYWRMALSRTKHAESYLHSRQARAIACLHLHVLKMNRRESPILQGNSRIQRCERGPVGVLFDYPPSNGRSPCAPFVAGSLRGQRLGLQRRRMYVVQHCVSLTTAVSERGSNLV